jgi:sulfate adenylyltransferase
VSRDATSGGGTDPTPVILDDDGLDRLELALNGALPVDDALGEVADRAGPGTVVLIDAENAPLARLDRTGDRSTAISALQSLPTAGGIVAEGRLRRVPDDVRREIAGEGPDRRVLAIVVDDVPTRSELAAVPDAIRQFGADALLLVVPASRRPRPAGSVGWPGVVRSALAAADGVRQARSDVRVVPLVVPWPTDASPDALERALEAFGVTATVRLSSLLAADERDRIARLPRVLREAVEEIYPPASAREVVRAVGGAGTGAVVFFTGLSGSGKSTIARALAADLRDAGRRVTLLDGDDVRRHLSSELGFDARSRERNIDRIAWVAALVAEHGGIAIAAPIAPFEAGRRRARALAEPHGPFVLVHVSTPLDVCEARDRKGLYARARAGDIAEFTGISSPYESPTDADVVLDTSHLEVDEAVGTVRGIVLRRLGDAVPSRPW